MNSGERLEGVGQALDHGIFPPQTDFDGLFDEVGDQMEIDLLTGCDMAEGDLFLMKREASIRIHDSRFFDTEDVLRRAKRFRKNERSEERLPRPPGLLKAQIRDLARCGMDLKVIIPMKLLLKNLADVLNGRKFVDGRGADDPVLEPAIGALDLPLAWGERA